MNNEANLIFEQYKSVNENMGMGPMVGKMVNVPGPGSQNTASKVVVLKLNNKKDSPCEDGEAVFIQAGDKMNVKVVVMIVVMMIMMVN